MGAAVPTGSDPWRKRRTSQIRQLFLQSFVFAIKRASLPPHPPHLSTIARAVPTHCHPRCATFAGPEQGDLGAERIAITIVLGSEMLDYAWHSHARDMRE